MLQILKYGFINFNLNYDIFKASKHDFDKTLSFLIDLGYHEDTDEGIDPSEIFKKKMKALSVVDEKELIQKFE